MQLLRTFLGLVCLATSSVASSLTINEPAIKGLSQTYGYLYGQDHSLQMIVHKYPDLSLQVVLAKREFMAAFPDMRSKLKTELRKALGDKRFAKLEGAIRREAGSMLGRQIISREVASEFIDQVRHRAKGAIESPVLEFLLAVKFENAPVREFLNGFRQRYETDGTGKSRGLILRLQLPRSWLAKDGERPHIVKKWVSQYGTGLEIIHLDIREGMEPTPKRENIEEFVRSGEVREVVPQGGLYHDSGIFIVEGQPGYWLEMSQTLERAGVTLRQRALMYQFFFRDKAIGLMCSAGGLPSDSERIDDTFSRIKSLCTQVLNTVVLPQAYGRSQRETR